MSEHDIAFWKDKEPIVFGSVVAGELLYSDTQNEVMNLHSAKVLQSNGNGDPVRMALDNNGVHGTANIKWTTAGDLESIEFDYKNKGTPDAKLIPDRDSDGWMTGLKYYKQGHTQPDAQLKVRYGLGQVVDMYVDKHNSGHWDARVGVGLNSMIWRWSNIQVDNDNGGSWLNYNLRSNGWSGPSMVSYDQADTRMEMSPGSFRFTAVRLPINSLRKLIRNNFARSSQLS